MLPTEILHEILTKTFKFSEADINKYQKQANQKIKILKLGLLKIVK